MSALFYDVVNRSGNKMHTLPIFLREDSSEFYAYPSDFFTPDRHTIFTKVFDTIYYYGINIKKFEPKVTMLSYAQADDYFHISEETHGFQITAFEKEIKKDALYLKHHAL